MKSTDFRIFESVENRLKLNVTLAAVATNKIPETLLALKKCMNLIEFSKIKFISDKLPPTLDKNIEFVQCPSLNYDTYMDYVFRELDQHISTSHCLLIQHDSWILRPQMWNNSWLKYDYIAPPWPEYLSMRLPSGKYVPVGCGGFALRSKKLMGLAKKFNLPLVEYIGPPTNAWAEDWNTCVYYRDFFLKKGIKYSSVKDAYEFGQEVATSPEIYPFGFHKYIR